MSRIIHIYNSASESSLGVGYISLKTGAYVKLTTGFNNSFQISFLFRLNIPLTNGDTIDLVRTSGNEYIRVTATATHYNFEAVIDGRTINTSLLISSVDFSVWHWVYLRNTKISNNHYPKLQLREINGSSNGKVLIDVGLTVNDFNTIPSIFNNVDIYFGTDGDISTFKGEIDISYLVVSDAGNYFPVYNSEIRVNPWTGIYASAVEEFWKLGDDDSLGVDGLSNTLSNGTQGLLRGTITGTATIE